MEIEVKHRECSVTGMCRSNRELRVSLENTGIDGREDKSMNAMLYYSDILLSSLRIE